MAIKHEPDREFNFHPDRGEGRGGGGEFVSGDGWSFPVMMTAPSSLYIEHVQVRTNIQEKIKNEKMLRL